MLEWMLNRLRRIIPCGIDKYFDKLDKGMTTLVRQLDRIEGKLQLEINMLSKEIALYKDMLESMGEAIPDMVWYKDLSGKYVYTNEAVREGLLFDRNPIGKTDVELAIKAKERFGNENHTFGEKCANSDKVVIEKALAGVFKKEDGRFLESGKVKGRMLYLEVFKAPKYVDGVLVGVVGTGRDMTEYVEAFREHNCGSCVKMQDIFKKYEYGEDM